MLFCKIAAYEIPEDTSSRRPDNNIYRSGVIGRGAAGQ